MKDTTVVLVAISAMAVASLITQCRTSIPEYYTRDETTVKMVEAKANGQELGQNPIPHVGTFPCVDCDAGSFLTSVNGTAFQVTGSEVIFIQGGSSEHDDRVACWCHDDDVRCFRGPNDFDAAVYHPCHLYLGRGICLPIP